MLIRQRVCCAKSSSGRGCAQTNPLITKALTSTGGFIVGDTLAQVASNGAENYDWCATAAGLERLAGAYKSGSRMMHNEVTLCLQHFPQVLRGQQFRIEAVMQL